MRRTAKQRGLLGHHFTNRLLHWPFPIRESWAPATRHHFVQGQLATSSAQSNIQTRTQTQSKPSAHAPRLPYSSQLCQHVAKPAMASRSQLATFYAPQLLQGGDWGAGGQSTQTWGKVKELWAGLPAAVPPWLPTTGRGHGSRMHSLPAAPWQASTWGGWRGARGSVNHCILQAINTNSSRMDRQLDGQTDSLPVFN